MRLGWEWGGILREREASEYRPAHIQLKRTMHHTHTLNRRTPILPIFALIAAMLGMLGWTLSATPCLAAPTQGAADRLVVRHPTVAPGQETALAVVLEHAAGWHTWPNAAVSLPEALEDFTIRTLVQAADPAALPPGLALGKTQYPGTKDQPVADPTGEKPTITVPLFSGSAPVFIPIRVGAATKPGSYDLKISVRYQSCNDKTCLMPVDETRTVTLTVGAERAAEVEPAIFSTLKPGDFEGTSTPPPAATSAPVPTATPPQVPPGASLAGTNLFGYTLPNPGGVGGLIVIALVSALGGFVLNLTPCVLPVIPIKILTLTQHAGSPGRALTLGLWMAFGVVSFWTLIGVPMAFVSSSFDPSRFIFGTWQVTLVLGLVIALMGLGIMGLFVINLPQSIYAVNPKADSPWGSFLFGVMTAVLGLPCFGFVAGGLLAGAATLPWYTIMVIFAGLGVGMAAPYLVLAARPNLLKFIPRTGPASELVKQVMGLLLMAAAAFFIAAGIKSLLAERPYLAGVMSWWTVTFFVVIAALWMTARTWQITKTTPPKVLVPVFALLLIGGALVFTTGLTSSEKEDWTKRSAQSKTEDGVSLIAGAWQPWTPARLEAAKAAGKVIIVDFTADWCINCKFLKRTVLDRDPVRARIAAPTHSMLEADLSQRSAPGWKYLEEATGQSGVPTLLIYGPGLASPIVFNAYTPENVIQALDKAAGSPGLTDAHR